MEFPFAHQQKARERAPEQDPRESGPTRTDEFNIFSFFQVRRTARGSEGWSL
jgi:hypothetical protein